MGSKLGLHEIAVVGDTLSLTTGAASARKEMLADADSAGPMIFIIKCDQDVYIRQGDSTVVAATTDFLLEAGASFTATVDHPDHAYVAAIQKSEAGTLRITELSNRHP